MNRLTGSWGRVWLLGAAASLAGSASHAQNPLGAAPTSALDTLSDAPVAGGNVALSRAQSVAQPGAPGAPAAGAPAPAPPGPGGPLGAPAPPGAPPLPPGTPPGVSEAVGAAGKAVGRVIRPKVKAIVGVRSFDPITGELMGDARLMSLPESAKDELPLYDDGTHGDLIPEDGLFANVEVKRDSIGQSNQRLKERLIQAIYTAEQLTPLEFYGYHILTTERHNPVPRNRRWRMVKDPAGLGSMLSEAATDKPLAVPKYREEEQRKDQKVAGKDGWAILFLDEYRLQRGDLQSDFFPVYVPPPPAPPFMAPPGGTEWKPFPHPEGSQPAAPGQADVYSKYGYKVKPSPNEGVEGAPTNQPYFNPALTQKAFGVNTGRR